MESTTNRIVNLRPPTQGTVPGTGVTLLATSVTASTANLSVAGSKFYGKHLRLYNNDPTDSIYVAFSVTGSTAIVKGNAGGTTAALGTVASNAIRIAPGASIDVRLTKALHVYIHLQASANTPALAIFPVSPGMAGA